MYRGRIYNCLGALIALGFAAAAHPQATSNSLSVRAIAEFETHNAEGRETSKLAAADKVVPGDRLIYTLEVRNTAPISVPRPVVTYAVPEHMTYLPDTAVGPGTEVTYSVDAGRSFDAPENLRIQEPGGQLRAAAAADYTHIRWQLKNALKGNSVAFVRFRSRVK